MATRRFNETPEQLIARIQHEDGDGGGVIETRQDITEIVDTNKYNYNERSGQRWKHFANHVASIPTSVYYQLIRDGIVNDIEDPEMERLRKWLDDIENQVFRTRNGRLI